MNHKHKILVVEDDAITGEMTVDVLKDEGYDVKLATTGKMAEQHAQRFEPDLILLDLGLPDIDGARLAKQLKKNIITTNALIVVLSARDDDLDIVLGLESYADDYLTKPYKPKMLTARLKAVLRRKQTQNNDQVIVLNDWELDQSTLSVRISDESIVLSKNEFDILYTLASYPNRIYSREQIVTLAKGEGYPITDRAIDMSIARIRKKLGDAGKYIETVRGAGYRLSLA
ncbi:hypothetical protein A8L45_11650 [Veronia pacifica]|uniref:DNA-binding response regulator n=2 Tax=Veronia pacifica TaxID=1080227 RepID=A0A1C3EIP1_9GAMM|nr:hypothetical protein A8L45_11650 [Veronia pacifica]